MLIQSVHSMGLMPIPVISTKLRPTYTGHNVLQRPRLLETLMAIVGCRLTLVCAGAGYGKTTLLSSITAFPSPIVWYSLGPSDQDLVVFISYLVEGIRRFQPGFGDRVLQLASMKEGNSVRPELIAGELVNSLSEIEGMDLIIVLDDYHFIDHNEAIRETVDYLLMHSPPNAHLVISTRRHPRLPSLPRLRFAGEINVITEDDLRFTLDEARMLFSEVYHLHLSDEALNAIARRTEGWVIALQLAAQPSKVQGPEDGDLFLADTGIQKRSLFEFFTEEVFKRQPPIVRQFLCQSALLSTFSAEACDAIFERTDSDEMLAYIEENHLFAVEVDDGRWRYHHLFRDYLRREFRRTCACVDNYHYRAGAYFEGRGDNPEAIEHYLLGADYHSAAAMISKEGQSLPCLSRFDTLVHWISQIPDTILRKTPDLLLLQTQVFERQGHYDLTLESAQRAAVAFESIKNTAGLCKVLLSKARVGFRRMDSQAEIDALCRELLDGLGPENRHERADLLNCVSLSLLARGDLDRALETSAQMLRIYESVGDQEGVLGTLVNTIASIHKRRGDFSEAIYTLHRALDLAEHLGSKYWIAEGIARVGALLQYLDHYDEAREYLERALALSREIGSVQIEAYALAYQGYSYLGGRAPDLKMARHCLEESLLLAERKGNEKVRVLSLMGQVTALRRLGEIRTSISLGNRLLDLAQIHKHLWFVSAAQMSVAASLMDEDAERAEALLQQAQAGFSKHEDKWSLTAINFWFAVLCRRSKPHQTLEYLDISLRIARANGYDDFFLEEHHTAVPLLVLAIRHHIYPEYCAHLLKYIGSTGVDNLKDLLTHQEGEIRQIAAEQLRNIAGEVPGVDTVLAHVRLDNSPMDIGQITLRTLPDQRVPLLRIHCFGDFRVYCGERLIHEREWQRRKVKNLLSYLASVQGHKVTKDEMIELFWGDLEPEAARANLGRCLYLLRRTLQPHQQGYSSIYVASKHGLLILCDEAIEMIDVDEFMGHVAAAQRAERLGNLKLVKEEYEEATSLYAGDFLADNPYEDWTIPKREYFRSLYLSALEKLSKLKMDAGDYDGAIVCSQRILADDCSREDVHTSLMQCFARTGRRQEAIRQYAACRATLKNELDLEPMRETTALYARLVAGEAV